MDNNTEIKKGDYVIFSNKSNHSEQEKTFAFGVMELRDNTITVKAKTKNGCFTKPYEYFEKVSDLTNLTIIESPYFEDNRTKK